MTGNIEDHFFLWFWSVKLMMIFLMLELTSFTSPIVWFSALESTRIQGVHGWKWPLVGTRKWPLFRIDNFHPIATGFGQKFEKSPFIFWDLIPKLFSDDFFKNWTGTSPLMSDNFFKKLLIRLHFSYFHFFFQFVCIAKLFNQSLFLNLGLKTFFHLTNVRLSD